MMSKVVEIGVSPPLGELPQEMYAQVIREERFGEPRSAFAIERVPVPAIAEDECLVHVMATGINYNNVFASAGTPVNIPRLHEKQGDGGCFHIGGSDASGIVYAVGSKITDVQVGDEVVLHAGWWDPEDPFIHAGGDPTLAPSLKMWGYETNFGGFAQFTRVKGHQVLPKPPHLSWEEAAAYMVSSAAAYRCLFGFPEHRLKKDDVVLIWGAAGGLGSIAIQLCRLAGAECIGVVSSEQKKDFCLSLGAKGVINRTDFDHWGTMPHWNDEVAYRPWLQEVRRFGKQIWDILGERKAPRIVFEHPGENTIPTSCFVCDTGGMIVICAGTSGYQVTLDLRYHWMRQKRLQGSHYGNLDEVRAVNDLFMDKKLDPCLSRTFSFEEIPLAHQLLGDNQHPPGNMSALVSAPEAGLGRKMD